MPKHFAYIDIFSYGMIFDVLNANKSTPLRIEAEAGTSNYIIDPKANNLSGLFLPNII